MEMLQAFSTLAVSSLILVYFIYVVRRYVPFFIRESTVFNHVILMATHLEWAFGFLLCYCLFPNYNYFLNRPEIGAGPLARDCYEWKRATSTDYGECSLCLLKVEEGEDIGVLRCGHIFHRFCLETWVGYSNLISPLRRGSLAAATFGSELGLEVLVFGF